MSGLKIFFKQVSKHVPFRVVAAVAPTLLRHDSQQTEKMGREIQNPELLPTQIRFSTEQSTLTIASLFMYRSTFTKTSLCCKNG
jgi:hypothetical protein